eukprot:11136236-Alexandrium_andersonii.AAC.1
MIADLKAEEGAKLVAVPLGVIGQLHKGEQVARLVRPRLAQITRHVLDSAECKACSGRLGSAENRHPKAEKCSSRRELALRGPTRCV